MTNAIIIVAVASLTPKYFPILNILLKINEPEYKTTGKNDTT